MFNNDDSQCPERHGGTNHTKVYIDSSQPRLVNSNIWREDDTLKVECYSEKYTEVIDCPCNEYSVEYDVKIFGDSVPEAVEYYSGTFKKLDRSEWFDLLAPLYYDKVKQLYLFSHHPQGLVWQISSSLVTTPVRALTTNPSCPDTKGLTWEWYNSTTKQGQQIYVKDTSIQLNCKW